MRTVNRGVALLDANAPGWFDKVDIDTLDLYSSTRCVLAQVYGGYFANATPILRLLRLTHNEAYLEKHGFNPRAGTHAASKKAWAKAINKRRLQQAQVEQYTRVLSKGFEYPNVVVQDSVKEDALCSF